MYDVCLLSPCVFFLRAFNFLKVDSISKQKSRKQVDDLQIQRCFFFIVEVFLCVLTYLLKTIGVMKKNALKPPSNPLVFVENRR